MDCHLAVHAAEAARLSRRSPTRPLVVSVEEVRGLNPEGDPVRTSTDRPWAVSLSSSVSRMWQTDTNFNARGAGERPH